MSLRSGEKTEQIGSLRADEWYNVQLTLDLQGQTVSGRVGTPVHVTDFSGKRFSPGWPGRIDQVVLDSAGHLPSQSERKLVLAAIDYDNLGIQETPFASVSSAPYHARGAPIEGDARAAGQQLKAACSKTGRLQWPTA